MAITESHQKQYFRQTWQFLLCQNTQGISREAKSILTKLAKILKEICKYLSFTWCGHLKYIWRFLWRRGLYLSLHRLKMYVKEACTFLRVSSHKHYLIKGRQPDDIQIFGDFKRPQSKTLWMLSYKLSEMHLNISVSNDDLQKFSNFHYQLFQPSPLTVIFHLVLLNI